MGIARKYILEVSGTQPNGATVNTDVEEFNLLDSFNGVVANNVSVQYETITIEQLGLLSDSEYLLRVQDFLYLINIQKDGVYNSLVDRAIFNSIQCNEVSIPTTTVNSTTTTTTTTTTAPTTTTTATTSTVAPNTTFGTRPPEPEPACISTLTTSTGVLTTALGAVTMSYGGVIILDNLGIDPNDYQIVAALEITEGINAGEISFIGSQYVPSNNWIEFDVNSSEGDVEALILVDFIPITNIAPSNCIEERIEIPIQISSDSGGGFS